VEQHTSRKSKVKLGTGQSASDIFISTKVTKTGRKNQDGSPIFTTEVIRYPSANSAESDGVVIATGSNEDGAPKISKTANITSTEERFLTSKIAEVRRQQMGTISSNFNLNAEEQKAYAEAGGTDRNPISQSQSNDDGVDPPPKTLQIDEIKSNTADPKYDDLVYPTGLRNFGQDFIMFTAYSYGGRSINPGANLSETQSLGIGTRDFGERNGSVSLPIQPSITDSNTVQWGSENLNPITAFAASLSLGAMSDPTKSFNEALGAAERQIKENKNLSPAARLYLAGKAVGVNGLLSRIGGGILNPNMELLFQGPQLRPFTFVFRLSAREESEANTIRKIIRYFKQNMAVKTTPDNLFLKAPNIFEIHYRQGGGKKLKDHPSLNKIKKCALQSCSVDYTPDGSYMTFNDENNTMVSYNLTLQFQELEPVTSKDYDNNLDQIGY